MRSMMVLPLAAICCVVDSMCRHADACTAYRRSPTYQITSLCLSMSGKTQCTPNRIHLTKKLRDIKAHSMHMAENLGTNRV